MPPVPALLLSRLRYYPPEKQGLRLVCISLLESLISTQILSSRKTRIKTAYKDICTSLSESLRYYPPEKQGLRQPVVCSTTGKAVELRYYPPEKQGLRLEVLTAVSGDFGPQILSSRKTRIKTGKTSPVSSSRHTQILSSRKTRIKTQRILLLHFRKP